MHLNYLKNCSLLLKRDGRRRQNKHLLMICKIYIYLSFHLDYRTIQMASLLLKLWLDCGWTENDLTGGSKFEIAGIATPSVVFSKDIRKGMHRILDLGGRSGKRMKVDPRYWAHFILFQFSEKKERQLDGLLKGTLRIATVTDRTERSDPLPALSLLFQP